MKQISLFFKVLLVLLLVQPALHAQEKKSFESLEDAIRTTGMFRGEYGPSNVNWINGGQEYSFIDYDRASRKKLIKTYNPESKTESVLFDASEFTFPNSDEEFSYRSFQWSKNSKYLLFQCNFRPVWRNSGNADYYFYSLKDKKLRLVAKDAYTAQISPDGTKVGFERKGNLFVYDLETEKETQLTNDAHDKVFNGRYGWAYEEEFGLVQAWKWSPDSKYIAYWQSDESEVPIFQMTNYEGNHVKYEEVPYPQVGDPNSKVKIGVVNIHNKDQHWMDVALNDGYIPRIYWTSEEGQLAITHLNRAQNDLKLFFAQATSGNAKLIMEEKQDTWIDMYDFFAGIMDYFFFPENSKEFFWISDKSGHKHVFRYSYSGKLLNQVTKGDYDVTYVHAVDPKSKTIWYTSTEESSLERHLYSIKFNGRHKRKLTEVAGRHEVDMAPSGAYYIDNYSNINGPGKVELRDGNGKLVSTLVDNEMVQKALDNHTFAKTELSSFTNKNGDKIDISIMKPANFDPNKKYPLLLDIYGGPGAQSVYNEWHANGWHQWLAQQGYVIVSVNNRGSGGYGKDFMKCVYAKLGEFESEDFAEAAQFMAKKPWIDGDHMAIRGHSYGGFMSSYTMLTHPGVFAVSLVGAPVTDWRNYDSIYAERYMGLLPENNENYKKSSSTTYAKNLDGHLYIAHSTMDDNVHVRNTFQLVKALEDNGKDFDMKIFPPGNHAVAYNWPSYLLLMQNYTDFLNRYMK